MLDIRIADLQIRIDNRLEYLKAFCREYCVHRGQADISIQIDVKAIDAERRAAGNEDYTDGYLETLAVYRMIGERLPLFDAFIFHAAVIEIDGLAYAFAAKSGTGKSTHIRHWKTLFGDRVTVVNGDKPIFRYIDGVLHACGTPWAGKEGWQSNACVPLAGVCFLERGQSDNISPLHPAQALALSLSQIYLPSERAAAEKTLSLLDRMLREIPLWRLQCTDSTHAAQVAYDDMLQKKN